MPAPQQSLIISAPTSTLKVALEPAHNAFNSLAILAKSYHLSGLGDWVNNTLQTMSDEERERHLKIFTGFYFTIQPQRGWPSFPAYLDHLASLPPQAIVDRLLEAYAALAKMKKGKEGKRSQQPRAVDRETILSSFDSYLEFLYSIFSAEHVYEEIEAEAYQLMGDPPVLQELLVSHLRHMWDRYLRDEWERIRPTLQSAVDAFGEVDLSNMSRLEAANFVTDRNLEELKWDEILQRAQEVIFVPSTHVGPYLGRFWHEEEGTLRIIFGARLPAGTQMKAPDLSRADIVVRLNALADDTRLRILKLVAEEGEMRTQEIMDRLQLSQSATSRHLKQLSAAAYLSERRCDGAKCYRLNEARVEDTLQAIAAFLLG